MASVQIIMKKDFQGLNQGGVYDLDPNAAEYLIKNQAAIPLVLEEEKIIDAPKITDMKVADLKVIAKEKGIKGYANMNKAKLVEAIESTEKG